MSYNLHRICFIGVDLGQRQNNTAIIVLERFEQCPDENERSQGLGFRKRYVVRQAERIPLGTPYQVIVKRIKSMVQKLSQLGSVVVVVDSTGIGIPIVEQMRIEHVGGHLIPLMITSGNSSVTETSVPRPALITKMQLMAQLGELEIAYGCNDGEALERELKHLTVEGAKRASEPDDLAFALALACWRAKIR